MAGLITVKSDVGRNSTVTVYLPASDQTPHPEPPRDQRIVRGSQTTLLVDDEQMIIDVAGAMLTRLGHKIVTAKGGQQAMEIMARTGEDIDLVILDLVMPDMGGEKAFDRLRELRPELPVIISSGYAIDGEAENVPAVSTLPRHSRCVPRV